jgi:hypothetical protein
MADIGLAPHPAVLSTHQAPRQWEKNGRGLLQAVVAPVLLVRGPRIAFTYKSWLNSSKSPIGSFRVMYIGGSTVRRIRPQKAPEVEADGLPRNVTEPRCGGTGDGARYPMIYDIDRDS